MSKADALAHLKSIACSKVSKADTIAHFKGIASTCEGSKAEASKANAVLDINIEKSKCTTRRDAIHSASLHTDTHTLYVIVCAQCVRVFLYTHGEHTLNTPYCDYSWHKSRHARVYRWHTSTRAHGEAHVTVAEGTPDRGWGGCRALIVPY